MQDQIIVDIIQACYKYYNIQSTGKRTRQREAVKPRFLAMWFLYKYAQFNLTQAARMLGYREHSMAIHAIRRCRNSIDTKQDLYEALMELDEKIENLVTTPMESV